MISAAAIETERDLAGRARTALLEAWNDPANNPASAGLAVPAQDALPSGTDDALDGPRAFDEDERPLPLIAVPVRKVRFLQAMAEDGPGARPCRIGGHPAQRVIQRTTC